MLPLTQLSRRIDAALNQFKALDLARRNSDFGPMEPYDPKKPWYPGISIRNSEDALDDIPEEGTAVVKYKVTRRGYDERNGKKKHDISMDLLSFDPQGVKKAEEKKKAEGRAVEMGSRFSVLGSRLHEFLGGTLSNLPLPSAAVRKIKVSRLKTSKRAPVVMKKTGMHPDEIRVSYRKEKMKDAGRRESSAYYTNSVKDARATAADMIRRVRAGAVKFSEFARGDQMMKLVKRMGPLTRGPNAMEKSAIRRGRLISKHYTPEGVQVIRDHFARQVKSLRKMRQFSEFADRPRDGDGQFVANVTGGADPVTMRQAYGDKKPEVKGSMGQGLLAPGAVAGTLASAGLLGTQKGRGMVVKAAKGASRMVRSAVTGIERKVKGRDTGRYPVMGSKAPKKIIKSPKGVGEVLMRQIMRGD
jgi:hypothetical protein